MKFTRPKVDSDVRYAHAEVLLSLINQVLEMPSAADGPETSVGSDSCLIQEPLPLTLKARLSSYHWTRAAGALFLNLLGAATGASIRAAASTQPLCRSDWSSMAKKPNTKDRDSNHRRRSSRIPTPIWVAVIG